MCYSKVGIRSGGLKLILFFWGGVPQAFPSHQIPALLPSLLHLLCDVLCCGIPGISIRGYPSLVSHQDRLCCLALCMFCDERCCLRRSCFGIVRKYASCCLRMTSGILSMRPMSKSPSHNLLPLLAEPILSEATVNFSELVPRHRIAQAAVTPAAFLVLQADASCLSVFEFYIYFDFFCCFHLFEFVRKKPGGCRAFYEHCYSTCCVVVWFVSLVHNTIIAHPKRTKRTSFYFFRILSIAKAPPFGSALSCHVQFCL